MNSNGLMKTVYAFCKDGDCWILATIISASTITQPEKNREAYNLNVWQTTANCLAHLYL